MKRSIIYLLLGFLPVFVQAQKPKAKHIRKLLESQEVLQEHFVGFVLEDGEGKIIYKEHADKYFIPASNTKLLTLYASLKILGDSIPAFDYSIQGDSLLIWGTGDPSFLHPKLDNGRVFDFLTNTPYTIYLVKQEEPEFEPSYWRADLAVFPIYGNTVTIQSDGKGGVKTSPEVMGQFISKDASLSLKTFDVVRTIVGDGLRYPDMDVPTDFSERIPFPSNHLVSQLLLSDTLKRSVQLIQASKPASFRTFYSIPSDTLYKHMMQPSDNFLAEQQLLLLASRVGDDLQVKNAIDYSLEQYFADFKFKPQWHDGSGLSRINLVTPSAVLDVLRLLEVELGQERIREILPAGGVSGTLKNAYKTADSGDPFVWAKTGTLRYAHLQSGWLESKKGNRYRFVFMNNNFVRPTATIREAMVEVMTTIWEQY
jgi:serine-type D-Ala-D-Ala carboxypeptidase/endopeptidase (penicillin-binding protein 4)